MPWIGSALTAPPGASKPASTPASTSLAATTNAACAQLTLSLFTASLPVWPIASSWNGAVASPNPTTKLPPISPHTCLPITLAASSPSSLLADQTSPLLREYAVHHPAHPLIFLDSRTGSRIHWRASASARPEPARAWPASRDRRREVERRAEPRKWRERCVSRGEIVRCLTE